MPSKSRPLKATRLTTWGIPLAYISITLTVGMLLPRVEHYLLPNLVTTMSVGAAMGICGAVASGMIALTGIVFSLVFVMVQFGSTAYSPRLVIWVSRDPIISHALGVFSATFLYALMLLGWIDRNGAGKVPMISSWLVFGLLIASMAMFIVLIERIGRLQVSRMLIFTANHGRKAIAELYAVNQREGSAKQRAYRTGEITQTLIYTGRPRVVQAIRVDALIEMAASADALIEVVAAVGDSVPEQAPLLRVHGSKHRFSEEELRATIEMGDERTFEQDPKYAIRLIVDVAIKALSPAINDPTTAVQALNEIEDLLLRLGRCRLDIGDYHDGNGRLRVVIPLPTWEDFVRLALNEIRVFGCNSVQVSRRMVALIRSLLNLLPERRHAVLIHWEERVRSTIERNFQDPEDRLEAEVADRQGLGLGEQKEQPEEMPKAA